MKTVNALQIRQKFGAVLAELQACNQPIMIEKGHEEVGVLIPIELFRERFVDYQNIEAQQKIMDAFEKGVAKPKEDSLSVLRELRYG